MPPLILMLQSFGLALFFYLLSIIAHELGHIAWFKSVKKKKIKLKIKRSGLGFNIIVGNQEDYNDLTNEEYRDLLQVGILFGIVPIVFACMIDIYMIYLIAAYIIGIRFDLNKLNEVNKEIEKTNPSKDEDDIF